MPRLGPRRARLGYLAGTALLAGISGAGFGGMAAAFLDLSIAIAATTSGVLLALIVGAVIYKYGEARPNEEL